MAKADPFRTADDSARSLARGLMDSATFGALAVLREGTQVPSISRIALAIDPDRRPMTLISSLSDHTRALHANPVCALLIGEPGETGDPLTHPRLTLHARAEFVPRATTEHDRLRGHYLELRPKAKLYVGFADFSFVRFSVTDGLLNGGFGKAWRLSPEDLALP